MNQYSKPVVPLLLALGAVLAAACSDGSSAPPAPTLLCFTSQAPPSGLTEPQDVEAQLEATVLREADLPEELQRSALFYSTNEELVQGDLDPEAELARLEELGRVLGVEEAFVPLDPGSSSSPVRGGIQNSVSVYRAPEGASQSLCEAVEEARQSDWEAQYSDLTDVSVEELPRGVGDESVWFRITGRDQGDQVVVDDQVVFRAARARVFLRVVSTFADADSADQFAGQVEDWADIVVDRARATFGE